jgi:UPF0176 protein
MSEKFKILLYYKYVKLENPESIKNAQKLLCQKLNLHGRILISDEGINGTLSGLTKDVDAYIAETTKTPEFADIEWKISWADEQVFPRLRVAVREEIVTLGIKRSGQDVSINNKADYIEPEELAKKYDNNDDFIIIDARNNYEADIGKFKNAVVPPIRNFRDFPEFVENNLTDYKDKEVITYCTGGVRCEKASAFLKEVGFKKVRQLHGGVHVYGEKAGGKHFEGELFVFDKRLNVPVNNVNPTLITKCTYCETPIARYVDCQGQGCNLLFICCEKCEIEHKSACCEKCKITSKIAVNSTL